MHRDRMLFLTLTSDPTSSAIERDFVNNVIKNELALGVQNKGGSARSNNIFTAYQVQYLKATQLASAKALTSRHFVSSIGSGFGSDFSVCNGSTTPNSASKTQ